MSDATAAGLRHRPSTPEDVQQLAEVLNAGPQDRGLFAWIKGGFNAHVWDKADTDPLYAAESS